MNMCTIPHPDSCSISQRPAGTILTSYSVTVIVTCLFLSAPIAQREMDQQVLPTLPKETTVTGIVVALGPRVIRDDDRCRQLLVVRATGRGNGKLQNRYLLVPRNYDCEAGDFTNQTFQNKRKWRFPIIRGADCDRTFEQIKDMPSVHPPGVFDSVPWMKFVPGNDGEKMSLKQNLLCYEING